MLVMMLSTIILCGKEMKMTRKQWLAKGATLEAIIEYAKMEGENDIYNAAMMLQIYLLKKDENDE